MLRGGGYDGITVPSGEMCTLLGAAVTGDVVAAPDSILVVVESEVLGNIIGEHALAVQVDETLFHGTNGITITGAGDSPTGITEVFIWQTTVTGGGITVTESAGSMQIDRNRVLQGDISVTANKVPPILDYPSELDVRNNRVVGDVTVSGNTGPGPKEVHWNDVIGAVACYDNEDPFSGGENFARTAAGQCS